MTHDGSFRGDKIVPLKDMVDEALEMQSTGNHTVEKLLIVKRTHNEIKIKAGRDYFYDALIKDCDIFCPITEVEAANRNN